MKAVPGVGSWIGGATQSALAAASTWAIGQVYRDQFEATGRLEGDAERLRTRFDVYLERARSVARDLRENVRFDGDEEADPRDEDLERLARLRRAGILREDEYERLVEALASADPDAAGRNE